MPRFRIIYTVSALVIIRHLQWPENASVSGISQVEIFHLPAMKIGLTKNRD